MGEGEERDREPRFGGGNRTIHHYSDFRFWGSPRPEGQGDLVYLLPPLPSPHPTDQPLQGREAAEHQGERPGLAGRLGDTLVRGHLELCLESGGAERSSGSVLHLPVLSGPGGTGSLIPS